MNYTTEQLELINLEAIQEYLYKRGSNDERINEKIKVVKKRKESSLKNIENLNIEILKKISDLHKQVINTFDIKDDVKDDVKEMLEAPFCEILKRNGVNISDQ